MSAEGPAATKKFRWVEGKYSRDDSMIFTKRFYVPVEERCPPTAEDESGVTGRLVEGSCIEVNKGCFIATAAFGSELDSHVRLLRHFRDEVLLQSDLRAPFSKVLEWYYGFSPPIAAAMKKRRAVKLLLKWILAYPVVLFVQALVTLLKVTHEDWNRKPRPEC